MTKPYTFEGQTYQLNDQGRIIDPGKFEGEPWWVLHFWSAGLDGGADEDVDGVMKFRLSYDDREDYPELADYDTLWIWEDNQGFVHHDADRQGGDEQ